MLKLWLIFGVAGLACQGCLIHAPKMTRQEAIEKMHPFTGLRHPGVDPATMIGKVLCGYQGWFSAEGDGSDRGWFHYAEKHILLALGHCTFDLWPDMSELDADEKFPTPFRHQDGRVAYLFSPYQQKTVLRHFRWMKDYGIDGVFLQRFGVSIKESKTLDFNHCNVVLSHVQAGANLYGRTWALMYDLSTLKPGQIETVIMEDWKLLVDRAKITTDPSYLHHQGKPVIGVWGVGFKDGRAYTLEETRKLVEFLKNDPHYGGNFVLLGLPSGWRTLSRDALADPNLHQIIMQADVVSPWCVGRIDSPQAARDLAQEVVKPDVQWCRDHGKIYLPVAFPGFSWHNLMKTNGMSAPSNQIPRRQGDFLWTQCAEYINAGANLLYIAMFDEIDEGTAIFKCTNDPPVGESPFLTFEGLPSDYYLWLTGQAGRMLRGEIPVAPQKPAYSPLP